MPNSLIEERDERTKKRKKFKKKMDSIIGLSYHDQEHNVMSLSVEGTLTGETARLLDEGYCDNGFVLKKGTLSKYLNGQNENVRGWTMGGDGHWERTDVLNLNDDFVGTVNLGHMDFATFPIILGEWTKDDMTLVNTENERQALNLDVRLDEESVFVKELRRQKHSIGVSAEFWYHINEEDTSELSYMLGTWMPVIDEIFIFAYALVGECGNVNSSDMNLKGGLIMPPNEKMDIEELDVQIEQNDDETAENPEETVELSDTNIEQTEEPIENGSESDHGEEAEVEEVIEEITDDDEDESDETEDDEADGLEQVLAIVTELRGQVEKLTAQIASLTTANEELKKTNRRLQGKLKNEKDKKEKFLANAKGISVALLPDEDIDEPQKNESEESVARRKYIYGDGIGEE